LLRLVDLDLTTVERLTVELLDRRCGRLGSPHGDERETARLARLAIGGHRHLAHLTASGEGGLDGGLSRTEREISYEKTITHDDFLLTDPNEGSAGLGRRARRVNCCVPQTGHGRAAFATTDAGGAGPKRPAARRHRPYAPGGLPEDGRVAAAERR